MSNSFTLVLKHSNNYLVASIASSAIAFFSIPLYTFFLNPEEFGIVTLFMSNVAILSSLMAFSTERSVSRFLYEVKTDNEIKSFVGTSIITALVFFTINSILISFFAVKFGNFLNLDYRLVYLILPMSGLNIIALLFEQIYTPLRKSKEVALSSFLRILLGFGLSLFFLLIVKEDRFYCLIYGQIASGALLCIYYIRVIKLYFKSSFDILYFNYLFKYSVPLIPYALSGVIIEQFGRITIGNQLGYMEAGFYSLTLAISSIVSIVIAVTNQAWNPFYFEYMNNKNYDSLDNDILRILKITLVVAFGVGTFGGDLGSLLVKQDFTSYFYLIPLITIGYVFYQLSFIYIRNFGYAKKTIFLSLSFILSGLSNVIFTHFLGNIYGVLGVSISFVISYLILLVITWSINEYFLKLYSTSWVKLIKPLVVVIPFYFILLVVGFMDDIFLIFGLKVLSFILLSVLLLGNDLKLAFVVLQAKYYKS